MFFARAGATRDLFSLIRAHPLVLLLGASGVGKSSLLRAGVIPAARQEGISILKPARLADPPEHLAADDESAVYSALVAWTDAKSASIPPTISVLREAFANRLRKDPSTHLAIFDQFEELAEDLTRDSALKAFIAFTQEILEQHANLRIVLSFRESALPAVADALEKGAFWDAIQFRLGRLSTRGARDAIALPFCHVGIQLPETLVEELLTQLRTVPRHTPSGSRPILLDHVDPFILQVACVDLWSRVRTSAPDLLKSLDTYSVTQALGAFCSSAIARASSRESVRKELWQLLGSGLLTAAGARKQVHVGEVLTRSIPRDSVLSLIEAGLLRREMHSGQEYLELAHDAMAPLVREQVVNRTHRELRQQARVARVMLVVGAVLALYIVEQRVTSWRREQSQRILADSLTRSAVANLSEQPASAAQLAAAALTLHRGHPALVARDSGIVAAALRRTYESSLRTGHVGPVRGVVLALGDSLVASAGEDRTVRLWSTLDTTARAVLRGHSDWVTGLAYDAASNGLFSISRDGRVQAWNVGRRSALLWRIQPSKSYARSIAVDGIGARVAVAYDDSRIRVFDQRSGQLVAAFAGSNAAVRALTFTPTGSYLVAGNDKGEIRIWNSRSFQRNRVLTVNLGSIYSLAFSDERQHEFVAIAGDSGLRLYRTGTYSRVRNLSSSIASNSVVRFIPGTTALVAATREGTITRWDDVRRDADSGTSIRANGGAILGLAVAGSGSTIITASTDGVLRVWTGAPVLRAEDVSIDSLLRLVKGVR